MPARAALLRIALTGAGGPLLAVACSGGDGGGAAQGRIAAPEAWTRAVDPSLRGDAVTTRVTDVLPRTGARPWLAVGYLVTSDGTRIPSTWRSRDGRTWHRTTLPPSDSPERRDGVFAVARRGDVSIAFGDKMETFDSVGPAAWLRRPGDAWSRVPHLGWMRRPPVLANSIEAAGADRRGLLAAAHGWTHRGGTVLVWRSRDGVGWQGPTYAQRPAPGAFALPTAFAANGRRTVLVGRVWRDREDRDAAIWLSGTGDGWRRVGSGNARLGGRGFQQINDVAPFSSGFVAVGTVRVRGVSQPTAWISDDGLRWRRAFVARAADAGGGGAWSVASAGGALLAAGEVDGSLRVWRSRDGIRWQALRTPEAMSAPQPWKRISLAAYRTEVVVAAMTESGSLVWMLRAGRWRSVSAENERAFPFGRRAVTVADVAVRAEVAVAVGNVWGEGAGGRVWRSSGGRRWLALSRPFTNASLTSVLAHEHGWFVAGAAGPRGYRAPALWRSDDGRSWIRASLLARIQPSLGNVVALGSSRTRLFAVVNEYEPGAVSITLWSSADGRRWRRHARIARGLDVATGACVSANAGIVVGTNVRERRGAVVLAGSSGLRHWHQELRPSSGELLGCALRGSHAVAVGMQRGHAAAWYREGRSWLEAETGELTSTAPASMLHAVTEASHGFLAAGTTGRRGQSDLGLWHSVDGRRWKPVEVRGSAGREPGYQGARSVAVAGRFTLLGGQHGAGDAAIWIGPTPSPALP